MTKKYSTKKALMASVLSLLLCFTMLLGTTFAWFTDSVTSANNIITSGNLDIVLEYYDVENAKWKDVKGASDILSGDRWEPGYTDVAYLRIKNNGSLALKYALSVNIVSETNGTNKAGEAFKLSDYIYFDVVDGKEPTFADRTAAMAAIDSEIKIFEGYSKSASLAADSGFVYLAMVVFMPTYVGNEANHDGVNVPRIDLGINVFATQDTVEADSFGTDYDADGAVASIAKANAMIAENKDVTLMGCNEIDGILVVPATYTGTLTVANSSIKSIQAQGDVDLVVLGGVTVNANGSGIATLAADESTVPFDGSAITAKGKLNITGSGMLSAIAADVNDAFGIGGMETESISIKDITIELVKGAYAYGVGSDTKYYKDAPEGGAAIGSGYDGAVIALDNVTVVNAIGGSKAAGIGARYHVGVTVSITDSEIAYVEGGVSAAAIGGSRVSSGATESGTTINITNSTVNAKGGVYGAGIGSGYDTHCSANQPLCTINITDSTITAEGGQYAAGVGTGYHNAALAGEIKNSTVNAKSGDKFYKDTYTSAIDIGFGVVDPAREGQQVDSKIIYNGTVIGIPAPGKSASVSSFEELKKALEEPIPNIYLSANVQTPEALNVGANTVINGNGYTLSRAAGYTGTLLSVGAEKTLTLSNIVLDGGAAWTGEINPVLQRGTVNTGVTATGALVVTQSNAKIVLEEGAILQNNDGANAVNLGTRVGATLTINGGEIINNHSAAGAIYGGGEITLNSGKVNGNHGGIGGAIRVVTNSGTVLTMNGGEMNHNYSDGNGGAIWAGSSKSNNVYVLNGGEMAYNYSAAAGGAIYAGYYETVKIGGTFKMHDNDCATALGSAIRFHNHASLVMTGGEIYNHDDNAFFLYNNSASITGGKYEGDFGYSGGLGLTLGEVEIDGVINFNLSTNHNTAYLSTEFGEIKFTVNEADANFANFNFKPAAGYTYTAGDEAKLICMNEGYSTYWDAASGTFKLKAN